MFSLSGFVPALLLLQSSPTPPLPSPAEAVALRVEHLDAVHADVWNSGAVTGSSTIDVEYAGPALTPRRRYYWTVCLRDQDGRAAHCAAPAWFETGQLGSA